MRVALGSEAATCGRRLGGTEGQRVGLATLCTAREGPPLAQRVHSVPADFAASCLRGGGSVPTPQYNNTNYVTTTTTTTNYVTTTTTNYARKPVRPYYVITTTTTRNYARKPIGRTIGVNFSV